VSNGRVRRADAEVRKTEILETTVRVVLERGFGHTRVADVAAALGVSTGLIHYHFASKDILLAEAFRFAADADIARVGKVLAEGSNALERLDRALRDYVPGDTGEEVWVLWIDAWGEALRDPALREISEELDLAWVTLFERIIVDGVAEGRFVCDDPGGVAWRLAALLDGLALHVTVHRRSMSRADMLEHARTSVCLELGLPRDAFPARPTT
jgi:AcrR family transcriptional regulator